MKIPAFSLVLASLGQLLRGDVVLAPLFGDHAVLQRGKPVPVWGAAEPGERVTVAFRGEQAAVQADAAGRWRVELKPREADARPAELTVSGRNTLVRRDVVVGEVWLASGQSNMEFKLGDSEGAAEAVASARFPSIRHIRLSHQVAGRPAETIRGEWRAAAPETAAEFTAVGYHFARDVFERLGVPVGIIHGSWGGTSIESWMPAESLAADPDFKAVGERWAKALADYPRRKDTFDAEIAAWTREQAAARAAGAPFTKPRPNPPAGPGHRDTPSGLYNGMIHPLAPFALRGVLWYQGENNASRAAEYRKLFPALITGWRAAFGQGDLPFYWVQLANYESPHGGENAWAFQREAQDLALSLPCTGQALAIDLGEARDIHPKNKREVGRRLALIALAKDYGQEVEFSGPRFEAATAEGGSMRVRLSHAAGLRVRGAEARLFELAGADRRFVPAVARIEGEELIVSAPGLAEPAAVRYAWRNNPEANVCNGAGLPLAPFRSRPW